MTEQTVTFTPEEYEDLERILQNEHRTQSEDDDSQWSPLICTWFDEKNDDPIQEAKDALDRLSIWAKEYGFQCYKNKPEYQENAMNQCKKDFITILNIIKELEAYNG